MEMDGLGTEMFQVFFKPIIDSGGVDFPQMRILQQKCELGNELQ
jgi:hypothetical protein